MNTSLWSVLLSVFAVLAASANGATRTIAEPDLDGLPPNVIYSDGKTFKADPYIAAAAQLQVLGKEEACRHLGDFALRNSPFGGGADAVFVLCRMLFVARPGKPFRGPGLGAPTEDEKQAPLAPIHVIDGIPFLTVQYTLFGAPETPRSYLLYCITQCDWSSYQYAPKSKAEKQAALAKLLASGWAKRRQPGEDAMKKQIEGTK